MKYKRELMLADLKLTEQFDGKTTDQWLMDQMDADSSKTFDKVIKSYC
jgi:hypothetical protein